MQKIPGSQQPDSATGGGSAYDPAAHAPTEQEQQRYPKPLTGEHQKVGDMGRSVLRTDLAGVPDLKNPLADSAAGVIDPPISPDPQGRMLVPLSDRKKESE